MSEHLQTLCDSSGRRRADAPCRCVRAMGETVRLRGRGGQSALHPGAARCTRLPDAAAVARCVYQPAWMVAGAGGQHESCAASRIRSRAHRPDGVRGELVHVGAGGDADFAGRDVRGCIVLVDGIATPPVRAARVAGRGHRDSCTSARTSICTRCASRRSGAARPTRRSANCRRPSFAPSRCGRRGAARAPGARRDAAVMLQAEVDTGWRKTPILVAEMDGRTAEATVRAVLRPSRHLVLRRDGQRLRQRHDAGSGAPVRGAARAGSVACGCASGPAIRTAAIPAPPGMWTRTGTSWTAAASRM